MKEQTDVKRQETVKNGQAYPPDDCASLQVAAGSIQLHPREHEHNTVYLPPTLPPVTARS